MGRRPTAWPPAVIPMVSSTLRRARLLFLTRHSSSLAAGFLLLSLAAVAADRSSPSSASSSTQDLSTNSASSSPFDYKIGDTATEEIIAPVSMVVVDPEETISLKQAEAARV